MALSLKIRYTDWIQKYKQSRRGSFESNLERIRRKHEIAKCPFIQ